MNHATWTVTDAEARLLIIRQFIYWNRILKRHKNTATEERVWTVCSLTGLENEML